MVEIKPESLQEIEKFIDQLRDTLNSYVNARIYVHEFENGMPVDAAIALRLVGDNLDSIKVYTGKIEDIIRNNEGTIYVKNPLSQSLTDIKIIINTEKYLDGYI
mgnify:CR=1 FL=1